MLEGILEKKKLILRTDFLEKSHTTLGLAENPDFLLIWVIHPCLFQMVLFGPQLRKWAEPGSVKINTEIETCHGLSDLLNIMFPFLHQVLSRFRNLFSVISLLFYWDFVPRCVGLRFVLVEIYLMLVVGVFPSLESQLTWVEDLVFTVRDPFQGRILTCSKLLI